MSVKGYFDFDVTVSGADSRGVVGSELMKVRFTMFDLIHSGTNPSDKERIAKEGAIGLVRKSHPTWTGLTVASCVEV